MSLQKALWFTAKLAVLFPNNFYQHPEALIMAFIFPDDKADFTAPNGVTYAWDGNKWRTKTYRLDDAALDDYLPKKNPAVTGALTVSPVDWMEQSKFCVTNGSSAYFILKPSATNDKCQVQYWGLTEGERDVATVGYVKSQLTGGDFMEVTGGTFTGDVTFKDSAKLKMGGEYNNKIMEEASGYTDNALVPTLGYVKSKLNILGDGGGGVTDPRLPYRLGTDKATRSGGEKTIDPSIELVDAEDNYSNVHFYGAGGIKTTSSPNGITIDGKDFLRDGFTARNTCIFRSGGNKRDSFKVTAETGGGTLWRLNADGGKDSPITYETANDCTHQFKVDVGGTVKEVVHFKPTKLDFLELSRFQQGVVVKGKDQTIDGSNVLDVRPEGGTYNGRISNNTDLVNKGYVDSVSKFATNKYDKTYNFINGGATTTVAPGQVIFTDISGVMMENPAKIRNICLSSSDFNWNAFTYNGTIKIVNASDVVAGYYVVLDTIENAGRNMTLVVNFIDRGGTAGSLSVTLDAFINFRNCFYD